MFFVYLSLEIIEIMISQFFYIHLSGFQWEKGFTLYSKLNSHHVQFTFNV